MQYLIRTNANEKIGLGHLSRSMSFAKLFKKSNCKILIDKGSRKLSSKLKNFNVSYLYKKGEKFNNETSDATKVSKILSKGKFDYVFVDDYRLGYKWEKYISKFCKKIICIDDFINRNHFSDVYINTKPDFIETKKFIKIISKHNKNNCKHLLGPNYYLPDEKLLKLKDKNKTKNFFTFTFYNGGSGDLLIFKKTIDKILKLNKIKINLIVGTFSKKKKIERFYRENKLINLIHNPKNIYKIFKDTDLLISSAGVVTYESAYLNVPTLLIKMNSNQENSDKGFEDIGHFFVLEKKDLRHTENFVNFLLTIKKNFKRIKNLIKSKKIYIKPNFKEIKKEIEQ